MFTITPLVQPAPDVPCCGMAEVCGTCVPVCVCTAPLLPDFVQLLEPLIESVLRLYHVPLSRPSAPFPAPHRRSAVSACAAPLPG
jgi:hypothetical protein